MNLKTLLFRLGPLVLLAALTAPATATPPAADPRGLVVRAFEAWAAGTGGPYELLHEDAHWTITGRSAAAGRYTSREHFLREVIRPFNARMASPLKPVIHHLYRDGDTVVVHFEARGVATDGVAYENTYSWHLRFEDGRIVEATAFFDSIAFDELWQRVVPRPSP